MSIRTHSAVFVISKILKEIFTPSEFRLHDPLWCVVTRSESDGTGHRQISIPDGEGIRHDHAHSWAAAATTQSWSKNAIFKKKSLSPFSRLTQVDLRELIFWTIFAQKYHQSCK